MEENRFLFRDDEFPRSKGGKKLREERKKQEKGGREGQKEDK